STLKSPIDHSFTTNWCETLPRRTPCRQQEGHERSADVRRNRKARAPDLRRSARSRTWKPELSPNRKRETDAKKPSHDRGRLRAPDATRTRQEYPADPRRERAWSARRCGAEAQRHRRVFLRG